MSAAMLILPVLLFILMGLYLWIARQNKVK